MPNGPKDKRRFPRMKGRFVIRYRLHGQKEIEDVTQAKDFSLGGISLTTNKEFSTGALLDMEIQLPVSQAKLNLVGKVLSSKEIVKGTIYETHIEFIDVNHR